jgi:hypothetical protein
MVEAEIKLADKIDAGQDRGEVAGRGERRNVRSPDICGYDELGISRQRVSEWRRLRDVGWLAIEPAIMEALNEGLARRRVRMSCARSPPHHRTAFGTVST